MIKPQLNRTVSSEQQLFDSWYKERKERENNEYENRHAQLYVQNVYHEAEAEAEAEADT